MLPTFDFSCNGFIRCNRAFERFRQVYFKLLFLYKHPLTCGEKVTGGGGAFFADHGVRPACNNFSTMSRNACFHLAHNQAGGRDGTSGPSYNGSVCGCSFCFLLHLSSDILLQFIAQTLPPIRLIAGAGELEITDFTVGGGIEEAGVFQSHISYY